MSTYRPYPVLADRYPLAFVAGVIDVLLVVAGAYLAFGWRFGNFDLPAFYLVATLVSAFVLVACQVLVGSYLSWRGRYFLRQWSRITLGWLLALAVLAVVAVLLQVSADYSRLWFGTAVAFGWVLTSCFRWGVFLFLRYTRVRGRNLKQVLVVESGSSAVPLWDRRDLLPENGYTVVQTLAFDRTQAWLDGLEQVVATSGAHEVWLCLPLEEGRYIKSVLHALRHQTVDVRYLPDLGDLPLLSHRVGEIAGLYTLDLSRSPMEGPARLVKRVEDLALGGLMSLIALPVCVVIAVAIKCTSRGPVIFKQYRTGINGRRFKVYKFRSMEVHQESDGQVQQARVGDARITRLGAFLRHTSLDELPQFYNVLQGRMSIVGPRPHALSHNDYYMEIVESYMQRHKVKPGITGWAQVCGYRGETDTLEKMEKRVQHDLWYIDHWSLGLDLKIIALTMVKGFVNRHP